MPSAKHSIDALTYEEKVALLDALWDSILAEEAGRAAPDWHKQIISQRLERMRTNPHPGFTIDEVFARVRERLNEKSPRENVPR